jgi:hypothetical protein
LFFGAEKSFDGLTGLTLYYDDDAAHPDSRLDQIVKTAYAKDGRAEKFPRYMSRKGVEEGPSLIERAKEKHDGALTKLAKKTGIHQSYLRLAERMGHGVGLYAAFRALGAAGIPAYPLIFGSFFAVKGAFNAVTGAKEAAALAGGKITTEQKEKMASHVAKSGVGIAMSSFGLYLLGILPATVAWPAALAALAVRGGKEIARILVNRKDHAAFREEARRFADLSVAEKIAAAGKRAGTPGKIEKS